MSKVLVDPAALEEAAKWLEVHSSSSGSAEAFAAEALREAIAQPAEAEGGIDLKPILEDVEREYEMGGLSDGLCADYASDVAKRYASAALSAVTAERDQLRAEAETWRAAARWSALRMSGMLASAQYSMTPETTHEVLELHHHVLAGTPEKIEWLAAMAAKEA